MSISSRSHETKDLDLEEKGGFEAEAPLEVSSQDDGIKREGSTGVIGWLWKVSKKLDSYGVEVRGVERVPEDERHHACVPRPSLGYSQALIKHDASTAGISTRERYGCRPT